MKPIKGLQLCSLLDSSIDNIDMKSQTLSLHVSKSSLPFNSKNCS